MTIQTIVERYYLQDIDGMLLRDVIELLQQINTKCQYPEGQKATFELPKHVCLDNQAPYIRVERLETKKERLTRLTMKQARKNDIKKRQTKIDQAKLQRVIQDDFND